MIHTQERSVLLLIQWRIQDFPKGAPTLEGAPTYLANISQTLHENEEILGQKGLGTRLSHPPDLLSSTCQNFLHIFLEIIIINFLKGSLEIFFTKQAGSKV